MTKRYSEPETNRNPRQETARNLKRTDLSFKHADRKEEEDVIDQLIKHLRLRVRRVWIALKYRFHVLTGGFFRRHAAIRVFSLVVLSYALFRDEGPKTTMESHPQEKAVSKSVLAEQRLDLLPSLQEKAEAHPTVKRKQPVPSTAKESAAPTLLIPGADEKTRRYIERFHQVAVAEMRKFGIPASISLAQGLIESRAGSSTLAQKNNNHFGMKCFSKNCGPGHCSNHMDDSHKDFFRIFHNAWESWRAHSIMITTGKYAGLRKNGLDYRKWARGLKKAGYATDRTYDDKLIAVIERYNLQRFDSN